MRTLNLLTTLLVIMGALNWLSVGILGEDLVANTFGSGRAPGAIITYVVIGLSGLIQLVPFVTALFRSEEDVEEAKFHR